MHISKPAMQTKLIQPIHNAKNYDWKSIKVLFNQMEKVCFKRVSYDDTNACVLVSSELADILLNSMQCSNSNDRSPRVHS